MINRHFYLVSAACLAALVLVSAQQQQFDENSVGQDFDYPSFEEPRPAPIRVKPQSGSRSRNSFTSPTQSTVPKAPPVQILKQINRHNEDGSYTYGFEGSDGSFKIETKAANGEVKGKYGYVDDSGKVRVVEYGANRYGFQPAGEGITVAPPTLVDESKLKTKKVPARPLSGFSGFTAAAPVTEEPEYDDGQFEEQQPQLQPQPQQQQFASRTPSRTVVQTRARHVARPAPAPAPVNIPRPSANFEFGSDTTSNFDFGSIQEQQTFSQGPRASFQDTQNFGEAPFRTSGGPVPPRAQIPGAAPVGPAPPRIVVAGAAPVVAPRTSSRASQVRPAPQFLFSQARQATRATSRQFATSSAFDDLEKQYALPSGGAPTHDISFSAF